MFMPLLSSFSAWLHYHPFNYNAFLVLDYKTEINISNKYKFYLFIQVKLSDISCDLNRKIPLKRIENKLFKTRAFPFVFILWCTKKNMHLLKFLFRLSSTSWSFFWRIDTFQSAAWRNSLQRKKNRKFCLDIGKIGFNHLAFRIENFIFTNKRLFLFLFVRFCFCVQMFVIPVALSYIPYVLNEFWL